MEIHRYKWHCSELEESIKTFAELHKNTCKDDFNDYFETWFENNHKSIEEETQYLNRMGYTGNIRVKIWSSIKYYYIKKYTRPSKPVCKRKPKERVPRDIIQIIKENMDVSRKPSVTYTEFINTYGLEDTDILKKAYKNQYYQQKLNKKIIYNES
jgi:hypothetical protein|tara:strand:+ start:415 stop:879 length:465 start_codon:yes stop_codon:yes gene_type:complete